MNYSIIWKLTGRVNLIQGIQNFSTWGQLKTILNRYFVDQCDEAKLTQATNYREAEIL